MREQKEEQTEEKKSFWKELWEYIRLVVIMLIVMFVIMNYVVINAQIPSESMQNTIQKGDRIFGLRLAYLNSAPERFDIVIFKFPDDESQLFIKRIIGMPGEKIEIKQGKVYVNNSAVPLDDSFCKEPPMMKDFGPYQVPEDSYFVLGDNRNWSKDSRYWVNTFVKREKILGKAGLRYFPLNKIGFVD